MDQLLSQYEAGFLVGMGEIATQYHGYRADDPSIEPYFALAEKMAAPTLIHSLGIGAPTKKFRVSNGDPRYVEQALAAHPDLKLYVENCGFPFLEPMIALMYQYANLYCDVSTITWIVPRQAFFDFLEKLVRADLGKRIMFGSDQMLLPQTIGMAIDAIQMAPFLTREQKADIFYGNAARFLELSESEIDAHHAK